MTSKSTFRPVGAPDNPGDDPSGLSTPALAMMAQANAFSSEYVGRNPNERLSRDQIEREYALSRRWMELAAVPGDGPPMLKISHRMVRYRRADLEDWLSSRTVRSTSEQVAA
ncbi:MAG: hypothetical protein AAFW98_04110 [Pseudomonadota bacterium]